MNNDIKKQIRMADLKQWEVAAELGISERTLCVWLRRELSEERKIKITDAIQRLIKKGENNAR